MACAWLWSNQVESGRKISAHQPTINHHHPWVMTDVPMGHITQPWMVYGQPNGYYGWWCPIYPKWDSYQPLSTIINSSDFFRTTSLWKKLSTGRWKAWTTCWNLTEEPCTSPKPHLLLLPPPPPPPPAHWLLIAAWQALEAKQLVAFFGLELNEWRIMKVWRFRIKLCMDMYGLVSSMFWGKKQV